MAQVTKDSEFETSPEFIESEKIHNTSKRKGGPYSKNEKSKRQDEVYRLHFEYGYSARKISELMRINRNTINGDINFWYEKIYENSTDIDPEESIIINTQRLNVQRTRLRERLDKVEGFQQIHAIEKMIFEMDCKIINTQMKLADSMKRDHKLGIYFLNEWLKRNEINERFVTYSDTIAVSEKAKEKISKIIKEDNTKKEM